MQATSVLEAVNAQELEERIEIPEVGQDLVDLAKEAEELLGYDGLLTAVDEKVAPPTQQRALLAILREQGVKLFRPEDVEAYKASEVDRIMKPLNKRVSVALRICLVSAAVLGMSLVFGYFRSIYWVIPLGAAAIVIASFVLACAFDSQCARTSAQWVRHDLGGYPRAVPAPALAVATNLKRYVPGLQFVVEEFKVTRRPLDPFLVVTHGEAEYAIAVWDESRFNAPPID